MSFSSSAAFAGHKSKHTYDGHHKPGRSDKDSGFFGRTIFTIILGGGREIITLGAGEGWETLTNRSFCSNFSFTCIEITTTISELFSGGGVQWIAAFFFFSFFSRWCVQWIAALLFNLTSLVWLPIFYLSFYFYQFAILPFKINKFATLTFISLYYECPFKSFIFPSWLATLCPSKSKIPRDIIFISNLGTWKTFAKVLINPSCTFILIVPTPKICVFWIMECLIQSSGCLKQALTHGQILFNIELGNLKSQELEILFNTLYMLCCSII